MRFRDLKLGEPLQGVLDACGYTDCTPIQASCLGTALEGSDIVGVARTGSGKTLAFLVPILDRLKPTGEVQALVVCPTRELALQVGGEAERLGTPLGVRSDVIYGGTSLGHQRQLLRKGLDVVVGTPGRLLDFLDSGYLTLRRVRWLVLDEADRMLDMGFITDVDRILRKAPMSRQTMLFSATLPPPILQLASRYMFHPREFRVETQVTVPPEIEQVFYRVAEPRKADLMRDLLQSENPAKAIVFTSTRKATAELASKIRRDGLSVHSMSSDLSQANRERVMERFRQGEIRILVATDVAGRGLDIDGISHVFNFDLPRAAEDYVHRIGRTGRIGRSGRAVSLYTPREEPLVREIESLLGRELRREHLQAFDPGPSDRPAARRGSRRGGGGAGEGARGARGGAGRRRAGGRGRGGGGSGRRRG